MLAAMGIVYVTAIWYVLGCGTFPSVQRRPVLQEKSPKTMQITEQCSCGIEQPSLVYIDHSWRGILLQLTDCLNELIKLISFSMAIDVVVMFTVSRMHHENYLFEIHIKYLIDTASKLGAEYLLVKIVDRRTSWNSRWKLIHLLTFIWFWAVSFVTYIAQL